MVHSCQEVTMEEADYGLKGCGFTTSSAITTGSSECLNIMIMQLSTKTCILTKSHSLVMENGCGDSLDLTRPQMSF